MVVVIDNFFGCYLLFSRNPKCKGLTYIGFTVNPERRITQHNRGKAKGGAWKTSNRGPWDMVLIVHGFPSDIAALRFEWAWQNPNRSRRLKDIVKAKSRKETRFQFRVRVVSHMLNQAPWNKLPLTVRWLKQEYAVPLPNCPPLHMPIAYGPVTAKVKKHKLSDDKLLLADAVVAQSTPPQVDDDQESTSSISCSVPDANSSQDSLGSDDECIPLLQRIRRKMKKDDAEPLQIKPTHSAVPVDSKSICSLCKTVLLPTSSVYCLNPGCKGRFHMICLSRHFLCNSANHSQLIPIEGACPCCETNLLWGDLIRESQGFHQYLKQDS